MGALGSAENQAPAGTGADLFCASPKPIRAQSEAKHSAPLQERTTGLEESIAHRRAFCNESVNLNTCALSGCRPDSCAHALASTGRVAGVFNRQKG